ncbi:hypothetical protein GCM10023324_05840 [Streptomyces youssoufiensis]
MTSVVRPGGGARPARRVAAAGCHGLRGTLTDEARALSADGRPTIGTEHADRGAATARPKRP